MMKSKLFAFFLPLFFLFSSLGADAATFQPNWKPGETFRYETTFLLQSADYNDQTASNISFETIFDATIITKYEVVKKSDTYTEFTASLESIQVRTPEKQYTFDIKTQNFLKNTTLHYQIDPQGKIIKITELDTLIKNYRQEFWPARSTDQSYENIWIEGCVNLWLNYSNYSLLPLSSYQAPHHFLYMGKDFSLNQSRENPIFITYAPLVPFTLQTIQLKLPGITTLKENNNELTFTSTYHVDKKDTILWGQIILDRLLLDSKKRKMYQEELDQYAQKDLLKFSASLTDTLRTADFYSLPTHSQSIFEFTASIEIYDEKYPTFRQGKFTITSNRLK